MHLTLVQNCGVIMNHSIIPIGEISFNVLSHNTLPVMLVCGFTVHNRTVHCSYITLTIGLRLIPSSLEQPSYQKYRMNCFEMLFIFCQSKGSF